MQNFGGVAVPIAVATLVAVIPYGVLAGIAVVVMTAMSGSGSSGAVDATALLVGSGIRLVSVLVLYLSIAYMLGGITQFSLRVARGERPEFGVVFSGGSTFMSMFGATLLSGIAVGIGSLFCIVPGFFIQGCLVAFSCLIVDKKMGAIDALSTSWNMTAPYRVNALVYALLAWLVSLGGTAACCVGALLVSTPVIAIANAYVYMKLSGEQPRLPS